MRKGYSDDFMWVLGIALILIIAVGIFSFFVPYTGPLTNITISKIAPGEVGFVNDFVARDIDLRTFTVGETQAESLKSWPQMELSAGIFGGNVETAQVSVPDYYLETARGVRISFTVYDTNQYGNIIMKWNGREILNRKLSKGGYDFFVDKDDVKGSNTIEAYVEGPGLFFWASDVYVLKNLNLNLEYGPSRIIPFEMLSSEMEKFDRAEIMAYAIGSGTLEIKVNGAQVYSGQPRGQFREEFSLFDAPFKPGQNVLTFTDESGTYTLRDTMFKLYITGDESKSSARFNMTEENFNFLANSIFDGKVDYYIDRISRPGSLTIEVNGRQLSVPTPRTGWNSAFFTADMVNVGENVISFGGTGSFLIMDGIIGLER